ncbi:MAG TPA: hypothetical protein PKD53_06295, partial [Chloroflexaceae bacterium]|nr:hypothetical protein [Chloroflexaceae bacterium]
MVGEQPRVQLQAIHARHAQVAQGHVEALGRGQPQRLAPVRGHHDAVGGVEGPQDYVNHGGIVLDEQHGAPLGPRGGRGGRGRRDRRGLGLRRPRPHRQHNPEGRAAPGPLGHPEGAPVGAHDPLADAQAQPRALNVMLPGRRGALEGLKEQRVFTFRDAHAGILHQEKHLGPLPPHTEQHITGGRKLDG